MNRLTKKEVISFINGWKQKVLTPSKVDPNTVELNVAELNIALLNKNRELLKQAGYDTFEEG